MCPCLLMLAGYMCCSRLLKVAHKELQILIDVK